MLDQFKLHHPQRIWPFDLPRKFSIPLTRKFLQRACFELPCDPWMLRTKTSSGRNPRAFRDQLDLRIEVEQQWLRCVP